jgi:hypothetical protein
MITITFTDAVQRLEAAGANFVFDDTEITTETKENGFKRVRRIPFVDSIGSLVSRDLVEAECRFWVVRSMQI